MENGNNGDGRGYHKGRGADLLALPSLGQIARLGNLAVVGNRGGKAGLVFEGQAYDGITADHEQGNLSTEALLGSGCRDAHHRVCDLQRLVPGVTSDRKFTQLQIDYPVVGPIGQLQAVAYSLYSRGRSVANPTQLTQAGVNWQALFAVNDPAAPWNGVFPLSMGFRLDWGVALLNWQPFDLNISTTNWVGEDSQPLNRSFTIRVNKDNGSSIYVPWAMRQTPPMAMALCQLARPVPQQGGLNISSITVSNIPLSISNNFGASVSFLTAAAPQTAAYAAHISLFGNVAGNVIENG